MGRLKIVYPICCEMDVHSNFVIACISTTNAQGVTEYQSRKFSTRTEELRELKGWLICNHCKDVCMESTGNIGFLYIIFRGHLQCYRQPPKIRKSKQEPKDRQEACSMERSSF